MDIEGVLASKSHNIAMMLTYLLTGTTGGTIKYADALAIYIRCKFIYVLFFIQGGQVKGIHSFCIAHPASPPPSYTHCTPAKSYSIDEILKQYYEM